MCTATPQHSKVHQCLPYRMSSASVARAAQLAPTSTFTLQQATRYTSAYRIACRALRWPGQPSWHRGAAASPGSFRRSGPLGATGCAACKPPSKAREGTVQQTRQSQPVTHRLTDCAARNNQQAAPGQSGRHVKAPGMPGPAYQNAAGPMRALLFSIYGRRRPESSRSAKARAHCSGMQQPQSSCGRLATANQLEWPAGTNYQQQQLLRTASKLAQQP